MDANLLPQWKSLLLCSIKSCVTGEQILIAAKMIDLFQLCFAHSLQKEEMALHLVDFFDAWTDKAEKLHVTSKISSI